MVGSSGSGKTCSEVLRSGGWSQNLWTPNQTNQVFVAQRPNCVDCHQPSWQKVSANPGNSSLKEMWQSTEVHLMTSSRNTKWPWKSWMNLQRESNLGSQRHCGLGTWHCRNHFSLLPSWKFLLAIVATWSGPTLAWMTLWFRIRRSQALLPSSYHKL